MCLKSHLLSLWSQYSNNVVVDFSGGGVAGGGVKPALGRTWTYVPSTRLMLTQQEHCLGEDGAVRIATITKSSRQVHTLHWICAQIQTMDQYYVSLAAAADCSCNCRLPQGVWVIIVKSRSSIRIKSVQLVYGVQNAKRLSDITLTTY